MNTPVISVIMPVFNVAKYLTATIQSIISQTYHNWELILIDDGSEDGSGDICNKFSTIDFRIKVVHTENRGVGHARNIGLKIAKGEYIIFADSDDLCHPIYFDQMLKAIQSMDCDIVFSNPIKINENGTEPNCELNNNNPTVFEKSDNIQDIPLSFFYVVWGKIYKRALLYENKLTFDERLNIGEDSLYAYMSAICASKICFNNSKFVNYRDREGSLIKKSIQNKTTFQQSIVIYNSFMDFCNDKHFNQRLCDKIKIIIQKSVIEGFLSCNTSYLQCRKNLISLRENSEMTEIQNKFLTRRQQFAKIAINKIGLRVSLLTYIITRVINY